MESPEGGVDPARGEGPHPAVAPDWDTGGGAGGGGVGGGAVEVGLGDEVRGGAVPEVEEVEAVCFVVGCAEKGWLGRSA